MESNNRTRKSPKEGHNSDKQNSSINSNENTENEADIVERPESKHSIARETHDEFSDSERNSQKSRSKSNKSNSESDSDNSQSMSNSVSNSASKSGSKSNSISKRSSISGKNKSIPTSTDKFKNQQKASFVFNDKLYGKKKSHSNSSEESDHENHDDEENQTEEEENEMDISNQSEIRLPTMDQNNEDIEKYYEYLRKQYQKSGGIKQWEDPEFQDDPNLFVRPGADINELAKLKDIEFERPDENDQDGIYFFYANKNSNFEYEFIINRGEINDKFFIGAVLMLFKRREQFFLNLVVDFEHVLENIKAGFCGFRFFINGEWINVTVDTRLPWHNNDNMSLSMATSIKGCLWLSLFEKAYAKVYKSYDVLNKVSIKNVLVDLTGGVSKKIEVKDKMEDQEKKSLFEEMRRCIQQKYLMGCMKYDENEEDIDQSRSEQGDEEEIISNSIYVIFDIQEAEGFKLVYLMNYWGKGKWTKMFSPDDETWETNKQLKIKLNYDVNQDYSFWMTFEDWLTNFNTLYYCRIFPPSWSQFCIPGAWSGIYSGGSPPTFDNPKDYMKSQINFGNKKNATSSQGFNSVNGKKSYAIANSNSSNFKATNGEVLASTSLSNNVAVMKKSNQGTFKNTNLATSNLKSGMAKDSDSLVKTKEMIKRVILNDSEDRWFLNPQFKIEMKPTTKLIITLLQSDEKKSGMPYQKCNFLIVMTKSKFSRVWDFKKENLIKKACETNILYPPREIILNLDYQEVLDKLTQKRKKKLLQKSEKIYINVIPYLEYNIKHEVEKPGNQRIYRMVKNECNFWLRVFSSDDIYISELPKPYYFALDGEWSSGCSGGGRFVRNSTNGRMEENPNWPINPQYLLKFDTNVSLKIILRKISGHFSNENTNIGMLLTKPNIEEKLLSAMKNVKSTSNFNKNDQILRVLESTNRLLNCKKMSTENIMRKLSFNSSEWVVESSYKNSYVSSLFMNFNNIDSPVLVIPTLENPDAYFAYQLSVFSNKPVDLISLNDDNSKVFPCEWRDNNAGGSHLIQDDSLQKKSIDQYAKKNIHWQDNPKFHISFDYKDRMTEVDFQVIVSRSESIWNKKIANSYVNAMIGVYIFRYERDAKWRTSCLNMDRVEFVPKNEIICGWTETKADPKGYVIMPVTYGPGVIGKFTVMVRSKYKFSVTPFNPKKGE